MLCRDPEEDHVAAADRAAADSEDHAEVALEDLAVADSEDLAVEASDRPREDREAGFIWAEDSTDAPTFTEAAEEDAWADSWA